MPKLESAEDEEWQESGSNDQLPESHHVIVRTVTWSTFLVLLLVILIVVIAEIAATGPVGVSHIIKPLTISRTAVFSVGRPPTVTAEAAFVYDPQLGLTYFAQNADMELPQASCTKIMTALLAVEHGNLNQVITVGTDAQALVRPDSSYMGLSAGEKLTLRDLLYGLLLPSGNDAAVAIADGISGNVPAFVALMNQRAQQLGLTRTHFMNPDGLGQPNHYTTARDLAVLAAVAMQNPILVQITSTKEYNIPKTATHKAYDLMTGDDLIPGARSPYPGAIGVKPGYTGDAGYCQAFAAIRYGHLIVGAVLNEPSWQIRITDMRNLLDWGFEQEAIPAAPPPIPWSYPTPET
ncbi:MAG: D-alanyl-D-alanine carboxypeptidase family protein [Ktedonobacterales bacterium]